MTVPLLPRAARSIGERLDAALLEALVKTGTAGELRQFRALTVISTADPLEAAAFVAAFVENLDAAIAILEARQ